MNKTYEEILDSMKSTYFNEYGTPVEESSQTLKRFEILASELFSISCYADYIFKQAFVQSATGENLDKLGELRECCRKSASTSQGELTFSISEVSDTDIIIEKNTVCSVYGKPYLQFATTQQGIIKAGELETTVEAVSLSCGDDYNAKPGTITVMVNAPISVTGVTNKERFHGGYSKESDSAYRNRILRHYNIMPNSINAVSNENRILTLDFVVDCSVVGATDTHSMVIYVATKSNTLSDEEKRQIAWVLPVIDGTGIDYEIELAQRLEFELIADAYIMTGFDEEKIRAQITEKIKEAVSETRINESIPLSRLRKAVADIDGLTDISFYADEIKGDSIISDEFGMLSLSEVVVNFAYE